MGVRDRRVLQIVKAMLKAGVMDECEINEDGTPQGGLISPLLANVYLDMMDEWISKQWENKKTRFPYGRQNTKYNALSKRTTLTPGYLVRFGRLRNHHRHPQPRRGMENPIANLSPQLIACQQKYKRNVA